ncbi:MAG: cation:proton antiporter, partial [Candidatus Ranarchaeia archaeon]
MVAEIDFRALELVALIILVGVVSARIAWRFNVPAVIPLLFAGAAIGPFGLKWFDPTQSGVSLTTLTFLFIPVLLFGESLFTDLGILRSVTKPLLMLITVGLLITALGITFICQYLFHLPFYTSLLIGAIVAATDPVVVIPLLKHLRVDKRISTLITAESSLNDAAAIVLTLIVLSILQGGSFSFVTSLSMFARLFFGGAIIGSFVTITLIVLINRFELGEHIAYLSLLIFIAAYASAEIFLTSGVTACVFAGLILGTELKSQGFHILQRENAFDLWENLMFLSEAAIFIILGAYLSVEMLRTSWVIGITITLGLFFLIRPLAVIISTSIDPTFNLKEKFFISWVGAKGAVSAGLAATALGLGVAYSSEVFTIVLSLVVFTIILVSFTSKRVAMKTVIHEKDTALTSYLSIRSKLLAKDLALQILEERYRNQEIDPLIYEKKLTEYQDAISEL